MFNFAQHRLCSHWHCDSKNSANKSYKKKLRRCCEMLKFLSFLCGRLVLRDFSCSWNSQ